MLHEQDTPAAEKIIRGPFSGSDRPDTIISSTVDATSQIIWKQPGKQISFDQDKVLVDPMTWEFHGGVVYRLAGEGENITDVVYAPETTLVVVRPNKTSAAQSVRAYPRDGIDQNYEPPKTVRIGEKLSLLSELCRGTLFSVVELVNAPDDVASADHTHPCAEDMLHGFRGRIGGEYDDVQHATVGKASELTALIPESSTRLKSAVSSVGTLAVQTQGVVIR